MTFQTALRGTVATIAVPIAMSAALEFDDSPWRTRLYGHLQTSESASLGEILRLAPILTQLGQATTSGNADVIEAPNRGGAADISFKSAEADAILWLSKPLVQLVELSRLPAAELPDETPIRPASIASAVKALLDLQDVQGPQPQVVARGDGGVQLVWYTRNRDLEIEVLASGKLEIVEFDGTKTRRTEYATEAAVSALERIGEALKT